MPLTAFVLDSYLNPNLGAWCLLSRKPLSDDVAEMAKSGQLHNPASEKATGRPPSKRLKNAHGPGSGRKKVRK